MGQCWSTEGSNLGKVLTRGPWVGLGYERGQSAHCRWQRWEEFGSGPEQEAGCGLGGGVHGVASQIRMRAELRGAVEQVLDESEGAGAPSGRSPVRRGGG